MTDGGDERNEDKSKKKTTAKSSSEGDIFQANYVLVLLMTLFEMYMAVIQNTD